MGTLTSWIPMIEGLWLKMGPMYYVRTTEWAAFRKVLVPAREHHVAIVAALKQRDPVAAGVAMREDVGAAIDVFIDHARIPSAEDASE